MEQQLDKACERTKSNGRFLVNNILIFASAWCLVIAQLQFFLIIIIVIKIIILIMIIIIIIIIIIRRRRRRIRWCSFFTINKINPLSVAPNLQENERKAFHDILILTNFFMSLAIFLSIFNQLWLSSCNFI